MTLGKLKALFKDCHKWEEIDWKPELGKDFEEVGEPIYLWENVSLEYAKYSYLEKCRGCGEERVRSEVALI